MNSLILGGAGFIGVALAKHLRSQGEDVVLVDNLENSRPANALGTGAIFLDRDIRKLKLSDIDYLGIDTIYHLAAVSNLAFCQAYPQVAYSVNTEGTVNICEIARQIGARVVFSSTSSVYRSTEVDRLSDEREFVQPDLVYARTKKAAEDACLAYYRTYGLDVRIFRFFNIYGAGQDHLRGNPSLVISLCHSLYSGKPTTIYGDGSQWRDYVYIDDIVRLMQLCGQKEGIGGEIINGCSGESHSVKDIVKILENLHCRTIPLEYKPAQTMWDNRKELFTGENPFNRQAVLAECLKKTLGDNYKARKLLGWSPTISIEQGLELCAREVYEKYYRRGY